MTSLPLIALLALSATPATKPAKAPGKTAGKHASKRAGKGTATKPSTAEPTAESKPVAAPEPTPAAAPAPTPVAAPAPAPVVTPDPTPVREVTPASAPVARPAPKALATRTAPPASDAAPAEASESTPGQGGLTLAAKAGFFKSTTPLQGAPYLAAEVGYITPLLHSRLAIVAEFDFHQPKVSGALTDAQIPEGSGNYTVTEREMALLVSAVYRFEGAWGSVTPYVGAGPGLYLHRATSEAFGSTVKESEGTVGVQALAGAELHLGPGGVFAEAHYHFTRIGFLSTGGVNVGGFLAASLGYRLHL